jgi:hypothetical protein
MGRTLLYVASLMAGAAISCGSDAFVPGDAASDAGAREPSARPTDGGLHAMVPLDATAEARADAEPMTPPPTACGPVDLVDDTVLARAATAYNACFSDDPFYVTLTGLRGLQGGARPFSRAMIACMAAVTNGCAGVGACFGVRETAVDAGACNTCVGSTAVRCGYHQRTIPFRIEYPCEALGATCDLGRCSFPKDPRCGSGSRFCTSDGTYLDCVNPSPAFDCKALGLGCTSSLDEGCQGLGPECSTPTKYQVDLVSDLACSGNVLTTCVRGRRANLACDCFGTGMSCQTAPRVDGGSALLFCGTASECSPLEKFSCDGSAVVFCNAGKRTRIECSSMGLSPCSPLSQNDNSQGCTPEPGWVFPD